MELVDRIAEALSKAFPHLIVTGGSAANAPHTLLVRETQRNMDDERYAWVLQPTTIDTVEISLYYIDSTHESGTAVMHQLTRNVKLLLEQVEEIVSVHLISYQDWSRLNNQFLFVVNLEVKELISLAPIKSDELSSFDSDLELEIY